MKQIVSVKDLEDMTRNGQDLRSLPSDALLTPSARDYLRDLEAPGNHNGRTALGTDQQLSGRAVTSKSSRNELEAFFNSQRIHDLKLQICEVGRRLWQRAYVDGNGGNIAIRVGEDIALSPPTPPSPPFLPPPPIPLPPLHANHPIGTNNRPSP